MRVVAKADLHLGFPGAGRMVGGRPQREVDVETAFAAAVENAIRWAPDLVTIAGDVFHHPRVSTHAVKVFRDGIGRLARAGIQVVIAQGNHDAAKTAGTLSPLCIPDDYDGVWVVTEPRRVRLRIPRTGEMASIAVFPYVAMGSGESYRVDPDPEADVNILLVHAAVRGDASGDQLPYFYGADATALDVAREAERWDAVLLGDFHEFRRLHPTRIVAYSGSIERTSSDIWSETRPKGIIAFDTSTGEFEFIEHPTRPMFSFNLKSFERPHEHVDTSSHLPADADFVTRAEAARADLARTAANAIESRRPSAANVNAALASISSSPDIDDALVRFVVDDFPREERDGIDWRLVGELKGRCTHFLFDPRYAARSVEASADRRVAARRTVEDEALALLGDRDPAERECVMGWLAAAASDAPVEREEVAHA